MNTAHAPIFDFLVHIMLARRSKTLIFLYFQKLRYLTSAFDRPEFQRMISDVETGKINCVIVKDLSRFGRDYIDTGRYLERIFPDLGIRFIAITDAIDSFKQAYDMLLPIKNIFNEQYARDISRKIHASVGAKQRSGQFIGSFACYGYKKSPENKNQLIIDEYAANVVRRIFDLFVQGYGKQEIAKLLNKEGILSPSEYKKTNGAKYQNKKRLDSTTYWSYTTINCILRHEVYIGNMVQGTKRQRMRGKQKALPRKEWIIVKSTHEAIIDKNTWEKTQILLQKRSKRMNFEQPNVGVNVFAGFLKCGDCGRAMIKHVWRLADGSKAFTLNCGTYRRYGRQYCSAHTISLKVLEDIVLQDLKTIVQSVDDLQGMVQQHKKTMIKKDSFVRKEISRITDELSRVSHLKKSVYEDYKDGLIMKEEFLSYRKEYLEREELYTQQLKVLKEKDQDSTDDILSNPWIKRLLEMKDIEKLDREIVVEMIKEIQIFENHRIVIQYNFGDELAHLFSSVYVTEK